MVTTATQAKTGVPAPPTPVTAGSRRRRETLAAYLFLAPDLLGLVVFILLPMVLAFGVAFYAVDGFGNYMFVGLDNYRMMGSDSKLWKALSVSGIYMLAFVPLTFCASLGLALLVRHRFRGVGWVRAAFFLPHVVSLVVVGLIWQFLLVDKRGAVATVLSPFGLGDISFLGSPSLALSTYIVISVWFFMGYFMLVFLAGLQDIPRDLEDAATVDGAGRWQRFRNVTWPLLRPTSFFVLVNAAIGAVTGLQAFDLAYVLTNGGPADATTTIVIYIYEQAFTMNNLGYAAAMTTLTVGILSVLTTVMFALTRGGRFDED